MTHDPIDQLKSEPFQEVAWFQRMTGEQRERPSCDRLAYSSLAHVTVNVPFATSSSPSPALNW